MAGDYSKFSEIDKNMAFKPANGDGIAWHLPYEKPMQLSGFSWFDKYHTYHRLPDELTPEVTQFPNGQKKMVPAESCGAYNLSPHTAGGQVRFRTDSGTFQLKGALLNIGGMDHMAFTGSAGFDLYLKCDGIWKCFGVTRTDHSVLEFSAEIVSGVRREMRDVIINFPLYNGVTSLAVGLDEDAAIEPPTPYADDTKVVWYGTSIQQGGCATRPGMASSNIVSRMLDREVVNLAFSGSGKGEPEIANMLADVKNAGLYLIDYTWNVDPEWLSATLPNVIDTIKKAYPDVPVVLVGPTPGRPSLPEMGLDSLQRKNEIMRAEAEKRRNAGDCSIFYFDAFHDALGEDYWECAVDGAHLTDLGFLRLSVALCDFLRKNNL